MQDEAQRADIPIEAFACDRSIVCRPSGPDAIQGGHATGAFDPGRGYVGPSGLKKTCGSKASTQHDSHRKKAIVDIPTHDNYLKSPQGADVSISPSLQSH